MIPKAPVPHVTRPANAKSWFGRQAESIAGVFALPLALAGAMTVMAASRLNVVAPVARRATRGEAAGDGAKAAATPPAPFAPIPFIRASHEHWEPFIDETIPAADFTAGSQLVDGGGSKVPAVGYMRAIWLHVQLTGGAGGGATFAADAPWNVLQDVTLNDVNGRPLFGPLSGFEAFLVHKWGAYGNGDPALLPGFSALDANGNGKFVLRIPVEISSRDALGSLANQNAASAYRLALRTAAKADVFTANPAGAQPSIRIRGWLEAWEQPAAANLAGHPQVVTPPAHGTVQFWSKQVFDAAAGFQKPRIEKVGNFIRNIILVHRTAAGARSDAVGPDQLQMFFDNQLRFDVINDLLKSWTFDRYGYAPGTGIQVFDFTHEWDGKAGGELRDLYLATTGATRLELAGTYQAAGTTTVLVNDIAPAKGQSIFYTQ
jgi:hypothetical protein